MSDEFENFLRPIDECCYELPVDCSLVEGMRVPGKIFINEKLKELLLMEHQKSKKNNVSFLSALTQVANVATLPGIVDSSIALPDIHSGYGFAIGNVAGFDMNDPQSVVSPGGVGFDINCGVRLIRTNLSLDDVLPVQEKLAQKIFEKIPVGVGSSASTIVSSLDLKQILEQGMDWSAREGISWENDSIFCESRGKINVVQEYSNNHLKVSEKAIKRGINQLGTLGAGNHYVEVQIVDEIFDQKGASSMGITSKGQVCIMIHCGSRGLGHQIASDSIEKMERSMIKNNITVVDRQLSCSRINSEEGQEYLSLMAAASNFAFVNRSKITQLLREAFEEIFPETNADDLDMQVVYDVAHNVAKEEIHMVNGEEKKLLVHRKGSTRAFAPGNPELPNEYQSLGQPVLVGGSMGTASYILAGTENAMIKSLGSTCHGAGRAQSRNSSKKLLSPESVMENLKSKGICLKAANFSQISEESPESYKDVHEVVESCHLSGISKKIVRLLPFCVIKG